MPISKPGIPLIPLIGPAQGKKKLKKQGSGSDTDDDDAFEGDEEDGDEEELLGEVEEEVDEAGTAIEAARDAARYSELCEQYDKTVQESESQPQDSPSSVFVAGPPPPPHAHPPSSSVLILKSELFDGNGKLAVSNMLDIREKHQSGTSVRLERILAVDTKFDKARAKVSEDTDSDVGLSKYNYIKFMAVF